LLLFTYTKTHTGIRLVPKLMISTDFEWHNGRYFALFTEFVRFGGQVCHSSWS